MKISFPNRLKFLVFFLTIIVISCTKDQDSTEIVLPKVQRGSINGTVKMYNKYGVIDANFADLTIHVTDSLKKHRSIQPDSNGMYSVDSVSYGTAIIKVEKAGYGLVDTLSFNLHKNAETLSPIILAQELPFKYNTFSISYSNGMIRYSRATTYQSTDSYLVGELICFGKNADVSINSCDFFMGTGSFSNVGTINWTINSATNCALANFTNSGSKIGDKIYSVCYPIIHAPFTIYDEQNYSILSYKIGDPSPKGSFILQQ